MKVLPRECGASGQRFPASSKPKENQSRGLRTNEWLCDAALVVDISERLTILSAPLRDPDNLVHKLFSLIKGVLLKLKLGKTS